MKNFFTVEEIESKTITEQFCEWKTKGYSEKNICDNCDCFKSTKNFNMIDSKKVLLEQSQSKKSSHIKKEVPKETLDKLKKDLVLTEGLKEIFKKTNKTK